MFWIEFFYRLRPFLAPLATGCRQGRRRARRDGAHLLQPQRLLPQAEQGALDFLETRDRPRAGRAVRARVKQTSSDRFGSPSVPSPQVKQALADADVCVSLRPDWEKAHFRRGMALEDKGEDNDALAAFEAAHATATGANNGDRQEDQAPQGQGPPLVHPRPQDQARRPLKADPSDKGGPKGDPEWLVTAKSPGQPIHVRSAR